MTFWSHLLFGRVAAPRPYVDDDAPLRRAQKAEAEAALRETQAQSGEVAEIAESLRVNRVRNHWGEAIERAMMRRDPPQ